MSRSSRGANVLLPMSTVLFLSLLWTKDNVLYYTGQSLAVTQQTAL